MFVVLLWNTVEVPNVNIKRRHDTALHTTE